MAKLPKQVQAQADAAEAYDKQMQPTEPQEPTPVEPVAQVQEPTTPVVPVTPQVPDPQWEQKFRSLQGIFNKQVPELQAKVRELTEEINRIKEQKTTAPQQPEPDERLVTDKDSESFGADLVDLARRVSREEYGKERKAYQKEIAELRSQLQQASTKVSEVQDATQRSTFDQFLDKLSNKLPDWKKIQDTEDCQNWLGTRVPGTDVDWNYALQRAANRMDIDGVLEIFGEFFNKYPAHNPVKPVVNDARSELEKQVSPSKPRGGSGPAAPQAKRIYTGEEYSAESMKQMRLEKAGKLKEAAVIEQELNAALMEGRVK